MATAFQASAFQNDAFQIDAEAVVGGYPLWQGPIVTNVLRLVWMIVRGVLIT